MSSSASASPVGAGLRDQAGGGAAVETTPKGHTRGGADGLPHTAGEVRSSAPAHVLGGWPLGVHQDRARTIDRCACHRWALGELSGSGVIGTSWTVLGEGQGGVQRLDMAVAVLRMPSGALCSHSPGEDIVDVLVPRDEGEIHEVLKLIPGSCVKTTHQRTDCRRPCAEVAKETLEVHNLSPGKPLPRSTCRSGVLAPVGWEACRSWEGSSSLRPRWRLYACEAKLGSTRQCLSRSDGAGCVSEVKFRQGSSSQSDTLCFCRRPRSDSGTDCVFSCVCERTAIRGLPHGQCPSRSSRKNLVALSELTGTLRSCYPQPEDCDPAETRGHGVSWTVLTLTGEERGETVSPVCSAWQHQGCCSGDRPLICEALSRLVVALRFLSSVMSHAVRKEW